MHTPPEDITVGGRYEKEEIEAAFDTVFGYRMSGINPRRDGQNNPYVLVCTNDGPYDGSLMDGPFEYVGEWVSGNQSETSPGNSALVDAVHGGLPVHFFYQDSGDGKWEYRGLVDVLDYEFEQRDGREVLVFTLQHQEVARD